MTKYLFPLNLQLFADGEPDNDGWDDDDLPDDDTDLDTETEDNADDAETEEPTTAEPEAETQEDASPEPVKHKIKYNGADEEYTEEEYRALAQKGRNYEKAQERAKQEARDAYVSEQGMEWRGKPITTEAQYRQALQEKEWEDSIRERNSSLPEDVVNELLEGRREREERAREKQEQATQAAQQAQVNDFLDYFQSVNDRPFSATDVIPAAVKAAVDQGVPLKIAYMEHQNKELMRQLRTHKQNETNQQKAPVSSVTAHGNKPQEPEDLFLAEFDKD